MPAFTLTGGPCHYDIHLCYYLFFGPRFVRDVIGNPNTREGRGLLRRESRSWQQRLTRWFHEFFNPDIADGEWKVYPIEPCCSFHIDICIRIPPAAWAGFDEAGIRNVIGANCGMLVVDAIDMDEHPHAQLGGERLLIGDDTQAKAKYSWVHEIGHNLGLPDQYHTPNVPELGVESNEMSEEEENAHRGHWMGKKDRNGRRAIDPHELADLAAVLHMACDEQRCCPPKARRGSDAEQQAAPEERSAGEEHGAIMSVPVFPAAHLGAALSFDLALEMLGPTLLKRYTRGSGRG